MSLIANELELHPLASLFPEMGPEDYEKLRDDIKENGLIESIWLHPDGRIIDGRHRHRACSELGIEPKTRTYQGESPTLFVVSLNLARRHLSSSQKALLSIELLPHLESEAKERMSAGGGDKKSGTQRIADPIVGAGEAREQAAKATGTNRQYVSDAKKLAATRPDLIEKVRKGEASIPEAKKIARKEEQEKRHAELAAQPTPEPVDGVFDLIYVDPPWRYDFSETDSRKIENHYPTEAIENICSIKPPAADNCLMLMWATAPKLMEAVELLGEWGFDYITHAVWDKQKIGMGYWFRGQHELLLVCTKGKVSPPIDKFRQSSIFSEARGKHSAKPDCVYQWIESAFPGMTKCEMFCRKPREGWSAWGKEASL